MYYQQDRQVIFLVWDVKTDEIKELTFTSSQAAFTKDLVYIASVAYPSETGVRFRVEGINNYTLNGVKRRIPSTEQTYLGKTAHIIMAYGRHIDIDTVNATLKIPKDTVIRNGKYSLRLTTDVVIPVPSGYSLIYLDTRDNSFLRVKENSSATTYNEEYILICTLQMDKVYKSRIDLQGVNNYTIDGKMGNLSNYVNDIGVEGTSISNPLLLPKSVKLIGHRGLSGLQPENTIPAFEECGIKGMWGVETDIRTTADGEFVCIHDATVDRTTDGVGNVSEFTLDQIRALNIDYGSNIENHTGLKVPTLKEMLLSCAKYGVVPFLHLYIDSSYLPQLVDEINKLGFRNSVVYTSTSPTDLNIISDLTNGQSLTFTLGGSTSNLSTINAPVRPNEGRYYDYNAYINYPDSIDQYHLTNRVAMAWVINDLAVAQDFVNRGIDGIATDVLFEL